MKIKFISAIGIVIILFFGIGITIFKSNNSTAKSTDFYYLKTNNNPDYYSEITLDGKNIYISGRYKNNSVEKILLQQAELEIDLNQDSENFSAVLSGSNILGGTDTITIKLKDAKQISYRIEYENGWHFDFNGLSEKNKAVFSKIYDLQSEAVKFYISPTGDEKEVKDTLDEIKRISDEICTGIENDYDKAQAICLWVSQNISYDFDARNTDVTEDTIAIKNVLERKRTVCAGFANTFAALLQAQGIRSINIKGSTAAGTVTYENLETGVQNHEWTAIEIDGRWFFADPTWNTENKYRDGTFDLGKQNLMYFDPSDEAFAFNHRADRAQERDYFNCIS